MAKDTKNTDRKKNKSQVLTKQGKKQMASKSASTSSQKKSSQKKTSPKKVKKFELRIPLNVNNLLRWAMIMVGILLVFSLFSKPMSNGEEVPISQVLKDVKEGKVEKMEVDGEAVTVTYPDQEKPLKTRKEQFDSLMHILALSEIDPTSVTINVKDQSFAKTWGNIAELLLPVLLTGLIFLFIFRQMRGAQDNMFSFGKNKAQMFMKGKQDVKFKDVGGVDEVKQELEEIVDFLKHPKKYSALGAKTPKGVLLVGPAGTGKTLLARAVAGEANVPFFSMAGSEFMEMLVGVGASRVRDLFATAKKAAPAIIFIDEIDAIGRQRGMGVAGGHDEREQTLNQILVEMDGFSPRDNVIVLAATNRGDLLDSALLRPGRFDRRVTFDLPDIEGRKHIVKIHSQGKPFVKNIDWERVAKRTVGFSGADLENMLNEAAIGAARGDKKDINYDDIEEAATKVKLGPRKKRLQSDEERRMTAYHEAGHALCAFYMEHADSVHRVSIISRGHALGYTQVPPEKDKYQETKSELVDQAVMLLGGRAAEEIEFNEMTGGAASDISSVTQLARRMVITYGMSKLGPVNLDPNDNLNPRQAYFGGNELSNNMQAKVDNEIQQIVENAHKRAIKTLKEHKDKLDLISKKLVEIETLEGDEFEKLMKK